MSEDGRPPSRWEREYDKLLEESLHRGLPKSGAAVIATQEQMRRDIVRLKVLVYMLVSFAQQAKAIPEEEEADLADLLEQIGFAPKGSGNDQPS